MKRNIMKAVEEGNALRRERPALDLGAEEMVLISEQIRKKGKEGIFNAIINAYSAGLAVGARNNVRKKGTTPMNNEAVFDAWNRAADKLDSRPEIILAADYIRDQEGLDDGSPAHWLARGFVMGLMEGREA